MQILEHAAAHVGLAEPPGFHERQLDFLAEPLAANPREERHQRGARRETGARRVGQRDISRAPRFHHSGHPAAAADPVFERVEAVIINPAGDPVDPAQT